jgi:hypothetical protein
MFEVIMTVTGNSYGRFPSRTAAMWCIQELCAVFGAQCQSSSITNHAYPLDTHNQEIQT